MAFVGAIEKIAMICAYSAGCAYCPSDIVWRNLLLNAIVSRAFLAASNGEIHAH
jgi:hypothetical protein